MLPKAEVVSVECDVVRGLHAFTIVGLPDKSVEEAKDRLAAAIKNTRLRERSGELESPKRSNKKIVLSLAPAALKKEGAAFDLPLALSFLLASEQVHFDPAGKLFAGELALDGNVRPILGALSITHAARDAGFTDVYVPAGNAEEAALISNVRVHSVSTLGNLLTQLEDAAEIVYVPHRVRRAHEDDALALDEIRGQASAKRGLIIAAAGGHNIALYGPPGTGKTLLARAAASILPDLSEEEMIEVTTIHSLAGSIAGGGAIFRPPFRSPHHTSSYASLIGGGSSGIRPGEATLAHRGVLFADEFPEFHRDVINALREPLEDRKVSISRAKGTAVFPANFMLIAALNPCPCGFLGTAQCQCMPHVVEKYRRKISGPIADRIDMWVSVGHIPLENLSTKVKRGEGETRHAREHVRKARERQRARFRDERGVSTNADMGPKEIEDYAALAPKAEAALQSAARSMKLSPRGYHRTIKLARTIADLAESLVIEPAHMLEALQYRAREL